MGTFNNEWNLSYFSHTFSLQHSNNLNTIFSFYSVTFAYLNTFSMIKFKAFVLFFFFVRSFIVSQFEVLYDSTNMHAQFSVWGLASMAPSLPGILGFFPCVWSSEKVVKVEEMFAPHNFHMEVYTWCSWISFSLFRTGFLIPSYTQQPHDVAQRHLKLKSLLLSEHSNNENQILEKLY